MPESIVEVLVPPTFILHDNEYSDGTISYDPATAVLMVQWDRALATQARRVVFPAVVEDLAVEVVIMSPSTSAVELRADSIALPPLVQGEQCTAEIAFLPASTEGTARIPKFKITTTIRGRPTGGG